MSDKWFGEDKAFHFCGCFTATLVLYAAYRLAFSPVGLAGEPALWIAVISGFICGLIVELFQEVTGEDSFSWKDMVYDGAGCLAAWALVAFNLI